MIPDIRIVFFCALLCVCILSAGCTGTSGNIPLNQTSPAVTTGIAQDSVPDLTNQNSPLAAAFSYDSSSTILKSPKVPVRLDKIAGGFSSPVMIAVPEDGSGRTAVVDQIGVVTMINRNNSVEAHPFLDLRDRMARLSSVYDERGLLSLAFHPYFRNNGRVFVFYSAPLRPGGPEGWSCTNRLSEFHIMTGNPEAIDMSSENILLTVDKPFSNHNGGPLLFGPDDGYLYLALGDGGRADDTGPGHTPATGNAQDGLTLLGKIIRIDIDAPGTGGRLYAIPPDNPFIGVAGFAPEIYALGFRNPAYASFDAGNNHTLIIASAGQQLFESVFIVDKGGNYGWNIREGTHCFNPADNTKPLPGPCRTTGTRNEPLIGPIIETGHDVGNTVVGGYIYRGAAMPELSGRYVFGAWSTGFTRGDGSLMVSSPPDGYDISLYPPAAGNITPQDNRMWTTQEMGITDNAGDRINAFVRGFGEDEFHELYILTSTKSGPDPGTTTGEIWKLGRG